MESLWMKDPANPFQWKMAGYQVFDALDDYLEGSKKIAGELGIELDDLESSLAIAQAAIFEAMTLVNEAENAKLYNQEV
jgi:hypothetical protein